MSLGSRQDYIETFFEYDVDIITRTLYVGTGLYSVDEESGVDAALAERVIKGLWILENYPGNKDRPIKVILNNCGGEVDHGLAIYDALSNCQNHIEIDVFGMAYSMATIILQAGNKRVLAPHSSFMIHRGTFGASGHPEDVKRSVEYYEKVQAKMEDIYLKSIREKKKRFTRSQLMTRLQFDTWMTPQEMIEIGLADEILGEEKDEKD